MRLSRIEIDQIKEAHPISEIVAGCGVKLSSHGERLEANCPFPWHDDTTPSFMVYPKRQTFRCFGCGIGGDVFDFLHYYHGWSFAQARAYLVGEQAAFPHAPAIPRNREDGSVPKATQRIAKTQDYRELLTRASSCYQTVLLHKPEALSYLKGRGITNETARRLHLGYCDGHTFLAQLNTMPPLHTAARAAGVLTDKGRERLVHRVVVPERRAGQVIYLIGRIVPPRRSRYKYLGIALPKHLLGYGEAIERLSQVPEQAIQGILVVEGALDYVIASQWHLPVVCVALLSTWASQLQIQEIKELLNRFKGVPVLIFLDADGAGARSTPTLLAQLQPYGRCVPSIDGAKDIGELGTIPDGRKRLLQTLEATLAERREDKQEPYPRT